MKANYLIVLTFSAALAACQPHPPQPSNVQRTPTTVADNTPQPSVSNGEISANANRAVVKNADQIAKLAPRISPSPKASILPNADSTVAVKRKLKNYTTNGIVKQIDFEGGSIVIDHEDIGDYMIAMEMPFPVVNRNVLKNLKVGDQVEFVLETGVGVERIVGIRKK